MKSSKERTNTMNTDFEKYLEQDEQILWQGTQVKKSSKKITTPIIFTVVLLAIAMLGGLLIKLNPGVEIVLYICATVLAISVYAAFFILCYCLAFIPKMLTTPLSKYAVTNKGMIRIRGNRVDIRKYKKCHKVVLYPNKDETGNILFDDYLVNDKKSVVKCYLAYVGGEKDFFAIENIVDANKVMSIIEAQKK